MTSIRRLDTKTKTPQLLEIADEVRAATRNQLVEKGKMRSDLGQFFTPASIAAYMAAMFDDMPEQVHLLDPGAGVGTLTAAFVSEACKRDRKPKHITAVVYEIDATQHTHLAETLESCKQVCAGSGILFDYEMHKTDFIADAARAMQYNMFFVAPFTHAILNPPYRKLNSKTDSRLQLRKAGIETSNLYAAFVWLAMGMLRDTGEMVAITPRSFCNGAYFKPFRAALLEGMALRHLHLFEHRDTVFGDDDVLQENIVFHAQRTYARDRHDVMISTGEEIDNHFSWMLAYEHLVHASDPDLFIHLPTGEHHTRASEIVRNLPATLDDLGLTVSTGRVVDFRAKEYIFTDGAESTVPLIWPGHFNAGWVNWPSTNVSKPAHIDVDIPDGLVPAGIYVLTKRFTSKEERRRVVAAIYDPKHIHAEQVGFENHLNYFHASGTGLPDDLARGLAAFLNSTMVDNYVRQFSGHTQVNATDLRNMRYPDRATLAMIGKAIGDAVADQARVDHVVENALKNHS